MSNLATAQRRIPLSRTHTTFTVNGVLGDTAQTIEAINPQTVNNVLAALSTVLTGSSSDLGPLLTDLESVAAAVNQRDTDLRQLVSNSQQVTATLAAKNQQLGSLVDSADGLLKQLIARRDDLVNVLGAGSSAVGQLSALIASEQAHLQQILGDLTVAVHALGQELPQVDQGFAWLGPTFTDLATIGANGPWFNVAVTGLNPDAVGVLSQTIGGGK
jgi:phospholipid/cholesterol/gamma-HCH transport system substrate-binding protein